MQADDKYTLKPSLAEKFQGIIWKIEVDAEKPIISVETRDPETHTANFSSFNFLTGACLFKEISVQDSWNWSLHSVFKGVTLLHSYANPEKPEHKGVIALSEGNILWEHHNKALYDLSTEGLIAYDPKIQPKFLEVLAVQSGMTIKSNIKTYSRLERDIRIPFFTSYQPEFSAFLPQEIAGELAFLETGTKKIFSFHIPKDKNYDQQLLITEADRLLLKDNIAENIPKLNPEAFFISQNHLFCIRDEKREIVSYFV